MFVNNDLLHFPNTENEDCCVHPASSYSRFEQRALFISFQKYRSVFQFNTDRTGRTINRETPIYFLNSRVLTVFFYIGGHINLEFFFCKDSGSVKLICRDGALRT